MKKQGIGHPRQGSLFKTHWRHRYSHGGVLRQQRAGRGQRPLVTREPIHLVFKLQRQRLRQKSLRCGRSFALCQAIIAKYAVRFFVGVEQLSVQGDHIHILLRARRRGAIQNFLRVVAGQIAQQFSKQGLLVAPLVTDGQKVRLWRYRPFTRVVRGWRAFQIVRDYIQLNEREARSEIPYRKERLRGMSSVDWELLWGP